MKKVILNYDDLEAYYHYVHLPKVEAAVADWIEEVRSDYEEAERKRGEEHSAFVPIAQVEYDWFRKKVEEWNLELSILHTCLFQAQRDGERYAGETVTIIAKINELELAIHFVQDGLLKSFSEYEFYIPPEPKPKFIDDSQRKSGITQEMIEEAKRYPIDKLIDFNRSYKALCIWHDEKSPSLHYYSKTNHVYCFGCHISADSIDTVMKLEGINFIEAIKRLR